MRDFCVDICLEFLLLSYLSAAAAAEASFLCVEMPSKTCLPKPRSNIFRILIKNQKVSLNTEQSIHDDVIYDEESLCMSDV